MFIYKTTNTINGKQYIGMCTRNDPNYLGSGSLIKSAIKKYGKENFTREIIEEHDDFEELCKREMYWIDYYNAVESDQFYNLCYGGAGGNSEILKEYWSNMTKEERQKSRNWKPYFLGLDQSGENHISKTKPDHCKKLSKGVKAYWDNISDEERKLRGKRVSESRKKNGTALGEKNPMYGRSAIREKNLKWYTNGVDTIYVTENTQPEGYWRGRTPKRKQK